MFIVEKPRMKLRTAGQLGSLADIEWGEKQEYKTGVQRGMKWRDGPWVKTGSRAGMHYL